ncbi:hydantoinase B/oxoprolinase family protein [Bradyrhizobium sp. DASA03007]|uniref:hydantoinase B/oxoprolinase family protein n=1 Tax=unclassified Bradyrhizobium TaxID=2631580 RepID=UPI003F72254D
MPNLETYEHLYPVRFRRQELRCDSAGPGRFRGGAGCDYEVEICTPADYAFCSEGVGPPSGLGAAGGKAGAGGEMEITQADGTVVHPPRYGVERYEAATYHARSPGGGGYGDPKTRDPSRVLRDVRDGIVSVDAAQREYGVAIARDRRSINEAITQKLRASRPSILR